MQTSDLKIFRHGLDRKKEEEVESESALRSVNVSVFDMSSGRCQTEEEEKTEENEKHQKQRMLSIV